MTNILKGLANLDFKFDNFKNTLPPDQRSELYLITEYTRTSGKRSEHALKLKFGPEELSSSSSSASESLMLDLISLMASKLDALAEMANYFEDRYTATGQSIAFTVVVVENGMRQQVAKLSEREGRFPIPSDMSNEEVKVQMSNDVTKVFAMMMLYREIHKPSK
jgi:hypothetical protein